MESLKDANSIAILGGTFNPIHNAHIMMAETVYNAFHPEKVLIMPNYQTYYKQEAATDNVNYRVDMINLAIADHPYMECSDMELKRSGITYTIDTIKELKDIYPDKKIYFIIGGDSLVWLDKWVKADELFKLTTFIAFSRHDISYDKAVSEKERILALYPYADIIVMKEEVPDISSSYIREAFKSGSSVEGMLPDSLIEYIDSNSLYKD